jgi:hypothetical protein
MTPKLQSVFNETETTRKNVLQLVKNMPEEKFFQSPEGKWSVSQILSHLIIAETLSLQYMKKKSLGLKDIDDTGFMENAKFLLLKIAQRLPIKYKAPAVLREKAPTNIPYNEIVRRWDQLRGEVKDFLEKFDDKSVNKKVYKHVVAGRLNVVQAIAFFNEHINHHLPQIKRLL